MTDYLVLISIGILIKPNDIPQNLDEIHTGSFYLSPKAILCIKEVGKDVCNHVPIITFRKKITDYSVKISGSDLCNLLLLQFFKSMSTKATTIQIWLQTVTT